MPKNNEELSIEEIMEQINKEISKISKEGISLEESVEGYKRGVELISLGKAKIDKIEKEIEILSKKGDEDDE